MKTRSFAISAAQASKASCVLCAKLSTPETQSGFITSGTSHHFSQASWRFRRDDGSPEARLGFGPTRKMVSIIRDEKCGETTFTLSIQS